MNNDVVSIPPNYPTSTTTPRPTHPHQTAKGLFFVITYHSECGAYVQYGLGLYPHSIPLLASYCLLGIMSTCVPLFFLINGALLFNRQFQLLRHLRRIATAIVLTIVWSVITQLALIVVGTTGPLSLIDIVRNTISLKNGVNNHLWFMFALIVLYCFFPLLKLAYDHSTPVFTTFLAIAAISTFGVTLFQNIVDVAQAAFTGNADKQCLIDPFGDFNPLRGLYGWSFVYFMLGGLIASPNHRKRLHSTKCRKLALGTLLLSTLVYFLFNLMFLYRGTALTDIVFGGYSNCWVLLMTCSLYILLEPVNIPKGVSGIIAFIGRNTLGLYFIHWIVIAAMHALGFSISPQFGYTIVPYLIAGLLIMLIGMCICWLIRRIPFANRLITP